MADTTKPGGWKTKATSIMIGVHAVIGMGLYFIGGPEVDGAVAPMVGVLQMLGGFGLWSARDAIAKVIGAIGK